MKTVTKYAGGDITRDLCLPRLLKEPLGGGWGPGATTHRENGLFDVGIPLVLPQDGPREWAGEVHARHQQVG